MTGSDAIEKAKAHILEAFTGYAYPIIPTDDFGNELDYEPGCVPWVSCTGIEIKACDFIGFDEEDNCFTIYVYADIDWNADHEEPLKEVDSCFEVWIPANGEAIDFSRVS